MKCMAGYVFIGRARATERSVLTRVLISRTLSSHLKRVGSEESFAFSGCGWLLPFHLGVVAALRRGLWISSSTVCAGTSGGAIAAMVACGQLDPHEALETIIRTARNDKFRKDISKGLLNALQELLSDDIARICSGRLHVFTTQVRPISALGPVIVNRFDSAEHLAAAIGASCFIPFYSSPDTLTARAGSDKSTAFIDGGVFAMMPTIGDVCISPLPSAFFLPPLPGFRKPHIFLQDGIYKPSTLLKWGFLPPEEAALKELFQHGVASAERWIAEQQSDNNKS